MTITTWTRWLPITIRRAATLTLAAASAVAAIQSPAQAQSGLQYYTGGLQSHGGGNHNHDDAGNHPTLHVNPRWKECSFQLDASLTQAAWRQFAGEAAVVTYFRPLTGAKPMGRGNFEVSVLQWKTGIDASEDAWNDTFVHPDSAHWLFEGSGLEFPGLTMRAGVTDRTDVGAYFTKSPGANYGFYGAQVQQNLIDNGKLSAAARVSYVTMYGPEDLEFSVYGADLLASREFTVWSGRAALSPYAVVSGSLGRAQEKSAVVDLDDENVFGAQATLGVEARLWRTRLGVEYGFARVSSFSIKMGMNVGSL